MMRRKLITIACLFSAAAGAYKFTPAGSHIKNIFDKVTNNDVIPYTPEETLLVGSDNIKGIIKLSTHLKGIGFDLGACGVNGIYTQDTENAVKWFQNRAGLTETGIANTETQRVIYDAYTQSPVYKTDQKQATVFVPSLVEYSAASQAEIRKYQMALILLDYNLSDCMTSGTLDTQTTAAIRSFKKDAEIYPITDTLDIRTQNALRARLAEQNIDIDSNHYLVEMLSTKAQQTESNNPILKQAQQRIRLQQLQKMRSSYQEKYDIPPYITEGIHNAALKTGWDISYLFMTVKQESSFKPWASPNCKDCTALGPGQFIRSTWLSTLKKHAGKHGYEDIVKTIIKSKDGTHSIKGTKDYKEYVYNLRTDEKLAILMAAEFAKENYDHLTKNVGITIGKTEVHMAHFFGKSGATTFLKKMRQNPSAHAYKDFTGPAGRNKRVFYINGDLKKPRTYAQIHSFFKKKIAPNGDNVLHLGAPINPNGLTERALQIPAQKKISYAQRL